jgi:16S rRNA processing protein RimM
MSPDLFAAAPLPDDAIELGRVLDAWGIKGWVRIQPHSADIDVLFASNTWFLQPPEARFARGFNAFAGSVCVALAEVKAHGEGMVARFEGMDSRNAAEALKGVRIYLSRSAFPATPDGEHYWVDLIGLEVFNREGQPMGVVRDLMSTGPHSVLVLAHTETVDGKEQDAERMIPFVAVYVDDVDQKARRITVDWQTDY